jgi:hypothetical protein
MLMPMSTLLQLLEDAGVDKAGPRGKILRFPAADVCLSRFIFFQTPFCQIRDLGGWGTICNNQSDYQDVLHAKLAPPPFFPRVTTENPRSDTFSSLPFVKFNYTPFLLSFCSNLINKPSPTRTYETRTGNIIHMDNRSYVSNVLDKKIVRKRFHRFSQGSDML